MVRVNNEDRLLSSAVPWPYYLFCMNMFYGNNLQWEETIQIDGIEKTVSVLKKGLCRPINCYYAVDSLDAAALYKWFQTDEEEQSFVNRAF